MSGKVVGWAMEQATGSPTTKLVLVKLADNAAEDGLCWPSIEKIVRHTELGLSTVYKHLAALEAAGLISPIEVERGHGTVRGYQLHLAGPIPPRRNEDVSIPPGRNTSPPAGKNPPPRGKTIPPRGTPYKEEPSSEPSEEPSHNPRAREAAPSADKKNPLSGFDRFWTELRNHWPDYEARNWPANKRAAENAWRVLDGAGELRPPGDMAAAARMEGRRRQAAVQAVKRPGDRPPHCKSPSAWLLERCFAGILDELNAPPPALADKTLDELAQSARRVIAPEHIEALRAQGIPDAEIAAWFLDAELLEEPPMVRAATHLKAKEIAKRYPRQVAALLRVAPEFVTFEWRRERAA